MASKSVTRSTGKGLAGKAASRAVIESLRGKFIADPRNTDLSVLRPVIARSWHRSAQFNVRTDRSALESVAEHQLDEQFLQAAEPVLADLERLCVDAHGCVSLTDRQGTIAVFRGEPATVRWASNTFPILGGCMSEDLVGTNSEGTAIEEGGAVQVWGAEHYNEALQDAFCTSVPVRDPLRRSVRGILSLMLPARVAGGLNPGSVLVTVQGAAAEISRALAARLAVREQALLAEYLIEIRKRGGDAIVAMDEHTTIASRGAMQLLEQSDYAILAAYAREARRTNQTFEHEVSCGSGRSMHLQVRPVSPGDALSGSIMRLRSVESAGGRIVYTSGAGRSDEFPELVGESLAFRRAVEAANTAARRGLGAYVVGEAGTGKRHLAEALACRLSEHTLTFDCGSGGTDALSDVARLAEKLAEGRSLVFHHVDRVDGEARDRLLQLLQTFEQPRVVLTLKQLSEASVPLISALRGIEIQMPALRARREDIALLVAHFLGRIDGAPKLAPRLMEALKAAEWPGNIAQLRALLEAVALRSGRPDIRLEDIPEVLRRGLGRERLSRLQRAELHQIQEALLEAGGNRVRAAALLRIGRSTLYRRIDFYTSRGFELTVTR